MSPTARFRDRRDAGRVLAARLAALVPPLASRGGVVVLALPRGGVPVAYEVARALDAPLDVLVVRKLGVPGDEELAMGAIASGGIDRPVRVLDLETIAALAIPASTLARVTEHEAFELARRERAYRGDRPPLDVRGRVVVLVDDGLATGATMRAALEAVRRLAPARIVVAAPVGASQSCAALRLVAGRCVCVVETDALDGVGRWYADFGQTSDAEVRALLGSAARRAPLSSSSA